MRILAAAAILLLSHTAFAQTPATYATLVEQYAAGDASGAVKLLAPGNARLSGEVVESVRHLPDRLVRPAIMMHTELAAAWLVSGQPEQAPVQIGNAQRLLAILTDDVRRRASAQTFAIRWYAFTAGLYAAQGMFDPAYRTVRDGMIAFPDGAELYVARGGVNEARAGVDSNGAFLTAYGEPASNNARRLLEAAASDYQRALSAEPTLAAAHLHRGWIFHRLGDSRAAAELEAALANATEDGTRYLARLFLGAAAERRGDIDAARREFEAARAIAPYQSAFVALGRIEGTLGHRDRARQLAAEYTQLTQKLEDPWWDYRLGGFITGALTWLRNEARQP